MRKLYNRSFLQKTPSIKDIGVKQLIKKYPNNLAPTSVKQDSEIIRQGPSQIIKQVNQELFSKNTKRYCNFVDMGMLNEKYFIDQNLKTA